MPIETKSNLDAALQKDDIDKLNNELLELFHVEKNESTIIGISKIGSVTLKEDQNGAHYVFASIDQKTLKHVIYISVQNDEVKAQILIDDKKEPKIQEIPKQGFSFSTYEGQLILLVSYKEEKFAYLLLDQEGADEDGDEEGINTLACVELEQFEKMPEEVQKSLRESFKEAVRTSKEAYIADRIENAAISIADVVAEAFPSRMVIFDSKLYTVLVDNEEGRAVNGVLEQIPYLVFLPIAEKSEQNKGLIISMLPDKRLSNAVIKIKNTSYENIISWKPVTVKAKQKEEQISYM